MYNGLMKKRVMEVLLITLALLCGCQEKVTPVTLTNTYTIAFYSVTDCSECKAFKKNAIPYLEEALGDQVTVVMYDLDSDEAEEPYTKAVESLMDFDDQYFGMGPFIDVEGCFAYIGYEGGDAKRLVSDIRSYDADEELSDEMASRRFMHT